MSKQQEALRLALEALDGTEALLSSMDVTHLLIYGEVEKAITALREALAEQPAQQEPVALDLTIDDEEDLALLRDMVVQSNDDLTPIRLVVGDGHSGYGLYVVSAEYPEEGATLLVSTSPPASKPWVGLTRDERMSIINRLIGQDWVYALDAIEAKLKEKNA